MNSFDHWKRNIDHNNKNHPLIAIVLVALVVWVIYLQSRIWSLEAKNKKTIKALQEVYYALEDSENNGPSKTRSIASTLEEPVQKKVRKPRVEKIPRPRKTTRKTKSKEEIIERAGERARRSEERMNRTEEKRARRARKQLKSILNELNDKILYEN